MQLHIFIFISLQWIFTSKIKLLFEVLMQIFQIFSIYFCTAKMQKSSYSFKKLYFSYFAINLGNIGSAVYGAEWIKLLRQCLQFTYFLPSYRVRSCKILFLQIMHRTSFVNLFEYSHVWEFLT